MMAKSHVAIGLASWVVAAPLLHLSLFDPGSLALAVGGSLLPDIDHPQSWVGRRSRPLSTAVSSMLGHRGITHSAIAVIALVFLLLYGGYSRATSSALAVGLSHLATDMLTPRGLRLAWPFRKTWSLPLCRTGSPAEPTIVVGLCALALWTSLHSVEMHHTGQAAHAWLAQSLTLVIRAFR